MCPWVAHSGSAGVLADPDDEQEAVTEKILSNWYKARRSSLVIVDHFYS
jgi:hypothetical protein